MNHRDTDIAVVGMSCRFPGASNIDEYWRNLCNSVESISFFSREELLAAGVPPENLQDPLYIPAYGAIADPYAFDATFFGMNSAEAIATDPQQRILLECAWTALEDASCDPARFNGAIGVFVGSGDTDHYSRVLADKDLISAVGKPVAFFGNCRDFMATRIAYKLGLRGPGMAIQTACSTSLVAIHVACQSLLNFECDLTLAGGVHVAPEQITAYRYQEGGILSPDGHCRAFDVDAKGTVGGSGAGLVVLKRMSDAFRDGDTIRALVRGSAINNDGALKVGFAAPSVTGQAEVIAEALAIAEVDAASIGYVETHGTGTPLGDPIEIAALSEAFKATGALHNPCALGAVKTNIGHLDTAAGVAGFIKTVLALETKTLPPTLHFKEPNAETHLSGSHFYVNSSLEKWTATGGPLRAGVSSFGVGGTNAHIVLEEASQPVSPQAIDSPHLLILSAKSEPALNLMRENLSSYLLHHPRASLADIACTLQEGRAEQKYRWASSVENVDHARRVLSSGNSPISKIQPGRNRSVSFLFPGQGTQYVEMAKGLYTSNPAFRRDFEDCLDGFGPDVSAVLLRALFPDEGGEPEAEAILQQTAYAQPALFAVEYALAKLWVSWGIQPDAMLGHSLGEYVAACLSCVFSSKEAARLVALRGRLMQELTPGAMLSVPLSEKDLRANLTSDLSLAAVNGNDRCVVSGNQTEISKLEASLASRRIETRRLRTSHAFHSSMMDGILKEFAEQVCRACPKTPQIPFLSNVTGDWIKPEEATNPTYWSRHLRSTVRFADGLNRLLENSDRVLLEIGPGTTLSALARRQASQQDLIVVGSLARSDQKDNSRLSILEALGSLWKAGVRIDWSLVYAGVPRRRISLPTYPFERQQYQVKTGKEEQPPTLMRTPTDSVLTPASEESAPTLPAYVKNERSLMPIESSQVKRANLIDRRLETLFGQLFGLQSDELDATCSFLELGADSLMLMQASRKLETEFKVRVPFRQMLDGLSSIKALSAHLNRELPQTFSLPENLIVPQAAPVAERSEPVLASTSQSEELGLPSHDGLSGAALQDVVNRQLAIMQMQLEMLSRKPPAAGAHDLVSPGSRSKTHLEAGLMLRSQKDKGLGSLPQAAPEDLPHGPYRPVRQSIKQGGGYDPHQTRYFERLVIRYNARTAKSKEYTAKHRPALADNRAVLGFRVATKELLYPVVGERSQGCRIWDLDGNEYIDFTCGFGTHLFGHRPQFLISAVENQLAKGFHLGPQSDLAGPLSLALSELTNVERVAFCTNGSEAVMTAIRIARAVTGRDRIAIFEGAYHGGFDSVLANTRQSLDGSLRSRPVAPGIPQTLVDDTIVLPYGTPESLAWLKRHGEDLAAVLVEPIQSRNLDFIPREFLHQVRSITTQSGAALIFDEMVTALRLGIEGAQGMLGIKADLTTFGKVLGGGFPLGVVAGNARFMDVIDGGMWSYGDESHPAINQTFFAGTYCKHPVSLAAAGAVLEHLRDSGETLYQDLNRRTKRLVTQLRDLIAEEQLPASVRHCGSLFTIVTNPNDPFATLLFYHLLEKGIYIWEQKNCFLSTAHTDADCMHLVRAFSESILELRAGGFLPSKETSRKETREPVPVLTIPLTAAQRQIWVHCQLGDYTTRAYNEQFAFRLPDLNHSALRDALEDVMLHHEALRTVFDPSGEMQCVLPSLPTEIHFETCASSHCNSLAQHLQNAAATSFDLSTGPLVRLYVHSCPSELAVVQIVFHHIVMDALGFGIFLRDLKHAYSMRLEGKAPLLLPAMQLSEYAFLLQKAGENGASEEKSWLERFDGAMPLELRTDHPRLAFSKNRAAKADIIIPAAPINKLRAFGIRNRCTLTMSLVAGILATLHRISGQEDIVIGLASAGRPFERSESLVGHCIEILPIRSQFIADMGLLEFVQKVRGLVLDAYGHERFSLATLAGKGGIPRGPTAPALVSVILNVEPNANRGEGRALFGKNEIETVVAPTLFSKFDLSFDAIESSEGLHLSCVFNSDLFERSTVERLLQQLGRVLEQVAENAVLRLSELVLLSGPERAQVLEEGNRTERTYPSKSCIHELFEAQVEQGPDRVAVVWDKASVTYGELNRSANQLAHYLRAHGVGTESRVAICLERSSELIVSLLAVLKAGGTYVPLDPGYPAERLAFLLANSAPTAVLTDRAFKDPLTHNNLQVPMFDLREAIDLCKRQPTTNLKPEAIRLTPQNLAYIIFTSGSTGVPKGVMVSHQSVCNRVDWMQHAYPLKPPDAVLQKTPYGFDVSVWELFWPLVTGVRLVVAIPEGHKNPAYLAQVIREQQITTVHFVPSMLQVFLDDEGVPGIWLRDLVCSGEELGVQLVRRVQEILPHVFLHNLYGPTETTVDSSAWNCPPAFDGILVPIGSPISNTKLYVLDDECEPVPVGVTGELYIAGIGVARGYLNRPALTSKQFLPDPFGGPGTRMYRSGDLARWRSDGTIEFLGRNDFQVKIRGFRVELGEIEARLGESPRVREARVLVREDRPGDQQLVAYLVGHADIDQVRADLKRKLPSYMIPAVFLLLDRLPLTSNGKLDRGALPAPETGAYNHAEYLAPQTPVEEMLVNIWSEILQRQQVGVKDDFFELGGHSLLAIRAIVRIRDLFQVNVPIRTFFSDPTVRSISVVIEQAVYQEVAAMPEVEAAKLAVNNA